MGKHADKIAALIADEEGKQMQYKVKGAGVWFNASFPANLAYDFWEYEYREKPFEPEAYDEVYAFWDEDDMSDKPIYSKCGGMEGSRYMDSEGSAWDNCRPLTEEEIGK